MKKLALILIATSVFALGFYQGRRYEVQDQIRYMMKLKALEEAEQICEPSYHASI